MKNQEKLKKVSDAYYLINSICCDFHNNKMDRSIPEIEIAYNQLQICMTLLQCIPVLIGNDNTQKYESENGTKNCHFQMHRIEQEN
jgi:hypothetical protein